MTDKQMIIDGVDVTKCRYFTSEWDFSNCGHICKGTECKYKRLWYKKQLKRKEQELEPFKDDYFKNLDTKTIAELAKKSIRLTAEYCKLDNILRDIKEICLQQNLKADFTACEVLDIINKAKEQ